LPPRRRHAEKETGHAAKPDRPDVPRASAAPCSPDFDPIETVLPKLKAPLRKAAERTTHGLRNAIGRLVDLFTPQDCANDFSAAGHDADRSGNALISA
jgi:transposase